MLLDIAEYHNNLYIHTGFVINKHPGVSRTTLVDAVNNKCANFHRKTKTDNNDSSLFEKQ